MSQEPQWLKIAREVAGHCADRIGLQRGWLRSSALRTAARVGGAADGARFGRRAGIHPRAAAPGEGLCDAEGGCARCGLCRWPRIDGARDQRRQMDPARRLGRRQSIGGRVRRAGNRRGIGIRGPGPEARGGLRLPKSGHPPRHIDSIYKMFFICEIVGGAARASDETSEVAFFPRDGLPPLSLGRTTAAQIDRMFHHREHPELATDFD